MLTDVARTRESLPNHELLPTGCCGARGVERGLGLAQTMSLGECTVALILPFVLVVKVAMLLADSHVSCAVIREHEIWMADSDR